MVMHFLDWVMLPAASDAVHPMSGEDEHSAPWQVTPQAEHVACRGGVAKPSRAHFCNSPSVISNDLRLMAGSPMFSGVLRVRGWVGFGEQRDAASESAAKALY